VTIFGQSGGGGKWARSWHAPGQRSLSARHSAKYLRVNRGPPEKATELTVALLAALNLNRNDVDKLQTLPVEKLEEASAKLPVLTRLDSWAAWARSSTDARFLKDPFTPARPRHRSMFP